MFIKVKEGKRGGAPEITFVDSDHIAKVQVAKASGLIGVDFFSTENIVIGHMNVSDGDEASMQVLRSILGDENTTEMLRSLSIDKPNA